MRRVSGFRLNRAWKKKPALKGKDPSGGTTGRVKPYGRLGWMGARAEYSLDGEELQLPHWIGRGGCAGRSRRFGDFLTFPNSLLRQEISARRAQFCLRRA